jgi:hypothetical protein
MIYAVAALAILVTMGLALIRALLGPTVYDRILAVNMFGTKTVLLIAVFAFLSGRTGAGYVSLPEACLVSSVDSACTDFRIFLHACMQLASPTPCVPY